MFAEASDVGSTIRAGVNFVESGWIGVAGGKLVTGEWTHIAFVYNPTTATPTIKIYQDGVEVGTEDVAGLRQPADVGNWYIGNDSNAPGNHGAFYGQMDDVAFYNRALTPAELAQVMAGNLTVSQQQIYHPLVSPANLSDPEPAGQRSVNFYDFDALADIWLEGPFLWP